jgi:hypothetical protein
MHSISNIPLIIVIKEIRGCGAGVALFFVHSPGNRFGVFQLLCFSGIRGFVGEISIGFTEPHPLIQQPSRLAMDDADYHQGSLLVC